MYGIVCHSMLLKHLILTYLRLVWMNFGLTRIVNIYGKPTYPGPEVDQEYYVITTMKLIDIGMLRPTCWPTRPTQPFILTGSINRVPTCPVAAVGVKSGRSPLSGGR